MAICKGGPNMAPYKGYNRPEINPGLAFIFKIIAWFARELGYAAPTRYNCLVCDSKALEREICRDCRKAILAFRSLADAS